MISSDKKEILEKKKRKAKNDKNLETKIKFLMKLSNELSLSGILIRPSELLFIWAILTLVPSSLILAFSRDFMVTLGVFLIGLFLPPMFMHFKKVKRVELFEKQLVDGVAIICNCLRSGLTFQQALDSIANEMADPIAKEFGRVLREIKLGNSLEKAMLNMSARLGSKDFGLIVSAVLIQRQVGGNLSEILASIAATIKERYKIKNDIKVLTTTGRTSGLVIGCMPIIILLFFMLINPDYVRSFFDSTIGIVLIVTAAVLETIGFIIIRKMVNIKY